MKEFFVKRKEGSKEENIKERKKKKKNRKWIEKNMI